MNTLNKSEEILRQLIAKEIQQVEFWFCDIYGFIKAFAIPIKQLTIDKEKEQFTLKGFDGSSIAGMAMITDSDVLAQVDITSACRYLPWDEYSVAFHCNLYDTNQVPYTKDIRHVLKNQVAKFNKHNFTISAKLEFYLFKQPNNTDTLEFTDHEGFFDLVSLAISKSFISHAILAAEKMGIAIEQFHHEVENSQFAVFLAPQNPVKTADDLVSLRYLLRRLANEQGLLASFYPKPIKNLEGSALKFCICVSHAENNHCAFSNKDDENQLSDFGKSFLMGLQKYGPETLLLTNQWVNSYKRLRSGFRAPLYFASSIESNETNIQTKVCGSREANAPKTGFCISHADAACNPYLALIGLIASGMAGVSHKGFKLWQNHKVLNPAEVNKELQPRMADNLQDAINAFKTSDLLSVVLGSEIYDHLLKIKKDEADRFKKYVTKWEQEHQLRVL